MPILFLLFIVVPILEIAVLVRVGATIGWFTTIVVVISTAALGTWMLREQGVKTLQTARARLDAGQLPAQEMLEGMVLLFGGALLLTPGFLTDTVGFLCLIPASRRWMAQRIGERARLRAGTAANATTFEAGAGGSGDTSKPGSAGRSKGGDVIDGEYERID